MSINGEVDIIRIQRMIKKIWIGGSERFGSMYANSLKRFHAGGKRRIGIIIHIVDRVCVSVHTHPRPQMNSQILRSEHGVQRKNQIPINV
jgi:hypothetical protein